MICEPFICYQGPQAGEIEWMRKICADLAPIPVGDAAGNRWKPYADFEREKLKELEAECIFVAEHRLSGYITLDYTSYQRIGYSTKDYARDSESSRLLKRAEFLKAVCEKEGVEWLPKPQEEECHVCKGTGMYRHFDANTLRRDVGKSPCLNCAEKTQDDEQECHCGKDGHPLGSINCPVHGRDTYTKAEIDERLSALLDALVAWRSDMHGFDDRELRRRFLS